MNSIKAGAAYETAENMEASHVNDRTFQLMFLRGNNFKPKAAADQAIRFFDIKLRLFRKEKLTKQISMKDLNDYDRNFLETGTIQLVGKDRMRRVIYWLQKPGLRRFKSIENELRARFYMGMNILETDDVQRKGFVTVTYADGQ